MMILGLIPNGFYQLMQSVNHGTWYARSAEVIGSPWMQWTVWLRIPGDIVFTLGAIGMVLFTVQVVYAVFCQPTQLGAPHPEYPFNPMANLITPPTTTLQLHDHLEFPESGVLSKVLWKDATCQYSLFCLAAGTEISEHTSTRNATVQVISGSGTLTLEGQPMALEPGVFVLMAANAPHALDATTNLAFLLTLSSEG